MKRRLLGLLMGLILLAGLCPATAFAEGKAPDEEKAASAETPIRDGDYLYFGEYQGMPLRWWVLDADAASTGEPGLFLVLDGALQSWGVPFDLEGEAAWEGSDAQAWCKSFYNSAFLSEEQAMIPAVSKSEEAFTGFDWNWDATELKGDQVFFLSAKETADYIGPENGTPGLTAYAYDGSLLYWWLRTAVAADQSGLMGLVVEGNRVYGNYAAMYRSARPAMNLIPRDLYLILPVREETPPGSYAPPRQATGQSWKFALRDDSLQLSLEAAEIRGSMLSVSYSEASAGEGNYLSLVVYDAEGQLIDYSRVAELTSPAGTAEIDMSLLHVPEGGKICFFAERGGQSGTVYAGALNELEFRISFDPGEGSGEMEPVMAPFGEGVQLPACTFRPQAGRAFAYWELDGVPVEDGTVFYKNTVLTAAYTLAMAKDIELDKPAVTLAALTSIDITAKVIPEDAVDTSIRWLNGDSEMLTLTDKGDGRCSIQANYPGTAVITAVAADGHVRREIQVTVTEAERQAGAAGAWPFIIGGAAAFVIVLALALILRSRGRPQAEEP